ncbi:hypothetical protein BGS_0848 [Beggiatoa sp. SS]|nr:hypothetical protein BGS_0848 [Beggiatoa sp. SS]
MYVETRCLASLVLSRLLFYHVETFSQTGGIDAKHRVSTASWFDVSQTRGIDARHRVETSLNDNELEKIDRW